MHKLTIAAALAIALAAAPALADSFTSSASSASSNSVSTSVGSISGSFEKSSESSTGDTKTAAGDYRVAAVGAAPGRPGFARLTLQAVADARAEFFLVVPQQTLDTSGVAAGQLVSIKQRPYGYEFAQHATQQAFFLLVADDSLRELQTKALAS